MTAAIEQLRIEASKIPTYDNCVEISKRVNCFYSTIEEIYDTKIEIFNYRMARFEDFCIPYSRNLRGITFDLNTKKLISLPLIKFFNYGICFYNYLFRCHFRGNFHHNIFSFIYRFIILQK